MTVHVVEVGGRRQQCGDEGLFWTGSEGVLADVIKGKRNG